MRSFFLPQNAPIMRLAVGGKAPADPLREFTYSAAPISLAGNKVNEGRGKGWDEKDGGKGSQSRPSGKGKILNYWKSKFNHKRESLAYIFLRLIVWVYFH